MCVIEPSRLCGDYETICTQLFLLFLSFLLYIKFDSIHVIFIKIMYIRLKQY